MSTDRDNETQETLKREMKALQATCLNTCQIIENAPSDVSIATVEELTSKIKSYLEGLCTEVQNSNTPFSTDENLLTSQFLTEIRKKNEEIEEMVAFTKGNIHDMNAEINRMQSLIDIAKEAKLKLKAVKAEVQPEHLQKAKVRFQLMKNTLRGLIESQFPDCHEPIVELLGNLMTAKLNDNPNGYIPITAGNYKLIELLKDVNIVTPNPYNNMEVKLTYY